MAEGLAVLGGVAASMQLAETAAKSLIGAVKLVKQLREIPKKTATHDSLFHEPSLSHSAERLVDALNEERDVLRPLVRDYNKAESQVKKLWREVVMVVREADVTEKLGSVKDINDDFLRELHITNMNMGVKTMTKLMETSSIVEVQRSESSRHYESIHTSTGHLHSNLAVGFEGVDQSLRNILSQSGRTTEMINAGFSDLRDDVKVSRDMLQELFRQQNQHITKQRKTLRDEMMSILTYPDSFNEQSSGLAMGTPEATNDAENRS
ncbi:hypothetical protein CaCOL14_008146 [Colletotrichum acutatum]